MAHASTASRQGWAASVVFHAVLVAALFFTHLRFQTDVPEFVEMSMGGFAGGGGGGGAMGVSPRALDAMARGAAPKGEEDNVALPARSASAFPEDAINLPSSKKNVNPDALPNFSPSQKISGEDRKYVPGSTSAGSKEMHPGLSGTGSGTGSGSGIGPGSGGGTGGGSGGGNGTGIGSGSGDGVSFGIQWSGAGTRHLQSGGMPAFPSGVNTEAQIKVKLVVLPNGTVKSAQPMQKGDTRLENAALKAVRVWKFDALQSGQPAVDQPCIVTFNFRLK
jgi:TonB family protein